MSNRFDDMAIGAERLGEEQLAVAGCSATHDVKVDACIFPAFVELAKRCFGNVERFAFVVCVERVEQVAALVDERELRGGRTGVDAQIGANGRTWLVSSRACRRRGRFMALAECDQLVFRLEERLTRAWA